MFRWCIISWVVLELNLFVSKFATGSEWRLFFHYSLRELTLSGPFKLNPNGPLAVVLFTVGFNHEEKFTGIRRLKVWRHISSRHEFPNQALQVFFKEIFTKQITRVWVKNKRCRFMYYFWWWVIVYKRSVVWELIFLSVCKRFSILLKYLLAISL